MFQEGSRRARVEAEALAINASSPIEIAWGYGRISGVQTKILSKLSKSGRWIQLPKAHVSPVDLAVLTAHTGDEFGLFTLGSRRIIVRGTKEQLVFDASLESKLLSQKWKWSAHTHPGTSDRVLMSSGGDRATLEIFMQSKSLILNSAGRANVFDLENDHLLSDELRRELGFSH